MPITDLLERNSKLYGDEIALVEINPEVQEEQRVTWKEYALIQPTSTAPYRREITWSVFDEKANRVANMLLSRGIRKGQKVAILLMNCLEWLPIYFGILKAGAIAVPLNFRYTSDEIDYCLKLADVDVLFFGPEFIGRMEAIAADTGCSIVFLHHASKGATMMGAGDQQQASRGSSVLVDNIRWQSYLSGMTAAEAEEWGVDDSQQPYFVRYGVSKANYGAPFKDRWFRRHDGGVLKPAVLEKQRKSKGVRRGEA